jgi:cell shape-determining protein MreC
VRISSQNIFVFVLVLTLVLCMAPGRALGVTGLLAEIMRMVFTPFTLLGNELAHAIWPPDPGIEGPINDPEFVGHLQQERDEFERLYIAEQAKVHALQQQIQQLQMFADEQLQVPVSPLMARIGLRSSESFGSVTLNRGTNHGVQTGTVAVHNRVHLLGKVIEASALQSTLLPLANPSIGLLDAVIMPRDRRIALENAPRIQLEAEGDGTLRGDIDRNLIVTVGDEVVLLDDTWAQSARATTIGKVEAIEPRDDQPLRNIVIVRPQYHVSDVAYVTLKIELEPGTTTQPATRPATATQPIRNGNRNRSGS